MVTRTRQATGEIFLTPERKPQEKGRFYNQKYWEMN